MSNVNVNVNIDMNVDVNVDVDVDVNVNGNDIHTCACCEIPNHAFILGLTCLLYDYKLLPSLH